MRKIMFSILFLWISTTTFGQSMDWTYLTVFPDLPITYVDDTRVVYESLDGVLKVEYELEQINGDNILHYDIQLNPKSNDPIASLEFYGYSEGSIYEPNVYIPFWSSYDSSPLSGSVILNQDDPETFDLVVEVYTTSNVRYFFGFFTTYYPN